MRAEKDGVVSAAEEVQHRLMDRRQGQGLSHGEFLKGDRTFSEDGKVVRHGRHSSWSSAPDGWIIPPALLSGQEAGPHLPTFPLFRQSSSMTQDSALPEPSPC
jgi:hypothetical protein